MRAPAIHRLEISISAHGSPIDTRSGASPRGGVSSVPACPLLPTGDGMILVDDLPVQTGSLVLVHQPPTYRGTIVAIGPEVEDLAVGDLVQYRPFVGTRIEVDGSAWMLVREEECVCRLD